MLRTALPLASSLFLATIGAFFVAPTTGCAPASSDDVASSSHASTAEDLADAKSILELLGGDEGRCSGCHTINAAKIRQWGNTMTSIEASCMAPEGLSAAARVECLRSAPGGSFSARRLGLYAAGVSSGAFRSIFTEAFAGSTSEHDQFAARASMPRSGDPLTEAEFTKLKNWVLRGMPQLDEAANPAPPASACTPSTTPELAAHIAAMKTEGWGARLADQATPMFGCNGASGIGCLTGLPDATPQFGNATVTQTLRQLHKQRLESHYWVRSSADGRYVGYGMNDSAKIVDLTKPAGAQDIAVEADYDPYFLPDNGGFAYAGSHEDGSIRLCRQSLLSDVGATASPHVGLDESKCSHIGDSVYMSIGTALDGNRYFMTFGSHENDDGGHEITSPLPAAFGATARTIFTPMINDGLTYRPQQQVTVSLPREGDMMLSPSSKLAATRFGNGAKQLGYRIRMIKPNADTTRIDTPMVAEVCMKGQKANISFDERFVATHQYVDNTEADQAALPRGSANIAVADLATGKQYRITTSKAGEYALYPHFRADGWLYFIVRDMNADVEYVVASDIALRASAE